MNRHFRPSVLRVAALTLVLSLTACGEPETDATATEDTSAYPSENLVDSPSNGDSPEQDRDPTPQTGTGGGIPGGASGQGTGD